MFALGRTRGHGHTGQLFRSRSKRSADLLSRSEAFRACQRSPVRFTIGPARRRAQIDRMSRLGRRSLYDRDIFVTVAYLAIILANTAKGFCLVS
jgi:hypothetical protein